jgi:hypothetical protein
MKVHMYPRRDAPILKTDCGRRTITKLLSERGFDK